ncbi:MAG: hypothetical protein M3042_11135 [Actinomycetota bacterium]|nr:hypothetical protein [Actinomycetota bacterium]
MGRHSPGGTRTGRFPLPPASLTLALGAAAVAAALILFTVAFASHHGGPLPAPSRDLQPSPAPLFTSSGPPVSPTPS